MLLEGLHIPLTTPFHPDGRLNPRKLAANVVRYSKTPAAGLIVLGPSGEPTLLSDEETREVLRTVAETASPEKVLIAGISRDSVSATLDLANFAAEQNYDAVLIAAPNFLMVNSSLLYNASISENEEEVSALLKNRQLKRTQERMTFFQTVADRSPLPIVLLYADGRSLPVRNTAELASHPNVLGFMGTIGGSAAIISALESTATIKREVTVTPTFAAITGRMRLAASANTAAANLVSASALTGTTTAVAEAPPIVASLRTRTKTVGFQILSGNAAGLLESLNAGAVGVAPAFAACAPQACYEIFAAWKDQDQPLAQEKQQRLIEAARMIEQLGPGALKFACDLNGYFGGHPRLPHLPPNGAERAELEQLMEPLRN